MKDLSYRQIHLDFHTSEKIKDIGKNYSKEQFQEALKVGNVDTINLFSKCHHGWSYHPSAVNDMHPELDFDLFGSMVEAAKEIGVSVQTYISAGLDEKFATKHPEWAFRHKDQKTTWVPDFLTAGYHLLCFNSPYLDRLLAQIEESLGHYETEGIWLDIVGVRECYCQNCVQTLINEGKDPRDTKAVRDLAERVYKNYTDKVEEIVDRVRPGIRIFHNSGHICRGRRDLAHMNTHLELESLPTGNYGYDHFPLSARYVETLGMQYLGMTGKFHTNWGEFGGYKHPNALRYETALSLLNGARCSIGDQMHPDGLMDTATYHLISKAYEEVKEREEWCKNTVNVVDVAYLSIEAIKESVTSLLGGPDGVDPSDVGALRILQEGKYLFNIVDLEADFNAYKVLILPDKVRITKVLKAKIEDFIEHGGKILATGESGLDENNNFTMDLGVSFLEENECCPSYFKPDFAINSIKNTSFVMYSKGYRVEIMDNAIQLGNLENAYFNRDVLHFCSHLHTPSSKENGGPGMVEGKQGIYFAWNIFEDYGTIGSIYMKEIIHFALDRLLGNNKTIETNLPSQGHLSLRYNNENDRYINHLVYATPVKRGKAKEVVEDIIPIIDTEVKIRLDKHVKKVYLVPEMETIAFKEVEDGIVYTVPKIDCQQMIVIEMV